MDNVYVYTIPMPDTVHEAVLPCEDGYTVYISNRLCDEQRAKAYDHAIKHIERNDCYKEADVQSIEAKAHKGR